MPISGTEGGKNHNITEVLTTTKTEQKSSTRESPHKDLNAPKSSLLLPWEPALADTLALFKEFQDAPEA